MKDFNLQKQVNQLPEKKWRREHTPAATVTEKLKAKKKKTVSGLECST